MDPAGTQRVLSGWRAVIGRQEQSILVTHESIAALARSMNALPVAARWLSNLTLAPVTRSLAVVA